MSGICVSNIFFMAADISLILFKDVGFASFSGYTDPRAAAEVVLYFSKKKKIKRSLQNYICNQTLKLQIYVQKGPVILKMKRPQLCTVLIKILVFMCFL